MGIHKFFAKCKIAKMASNRVSLTRERAEIIEKLIESGDTTRKAAEMTGLSMRTIQNYVRSHMSEEEGQPWRPYEAKKRGRQENKLEARKDSVAALLEQDSSLTQSQIIDRLPVDLVCSRRTLAATLKAMNYSRKRLRKIPIERNTPTNIQLRKTYASSIVRKSDSKLYFLDETGLNLHYGPRFGYSFRGTTPTLTQPGNRGQSISILVCIGLHGVLHWEMVD